VTEQSETDEQRADRLEIERDHAAGGHQYCGVTCETEMPSDMLRNFILAKGYPGTAGALDELLRRAALTPPDVAAVQPEPEAHPTTTSWICETEECDDQWMFLGASPDRSVIEERIARQQKRFPSWADGTPVRRRIVRKTTTYTVATEETPR
jgi:hypothetical protein